MSKPDIPERVTKLEQQMPDVNRKADDAITLARGADHDVADFRVELRAHNKTLEALRETQLEHGKRMDEGFSKLDRLQSETYEGFSKLDRLQSETYEGFRMLAAGQAHITALLTTALERPEESSS